MIGLGICILVGAMMVYTGCDSIAKELYKNREEGRNSERNKRVK